MGWLDIRNTKVSVLDVLEVLSKGNDTKAVLGQFPALLAADVADSAATALRIIIHHCAQCRITESALAEDRRIRMEHPKPGGWTDDEKLELANLLKSGASIEHLARIFLTMNSEILTILKDGDYSELKNAGGLKMTDIMIRDTSVSIMAVLDLIAAGYSYKQVLETHPALSLGDIMLSARVAKELVEKIILLEQDARIEGTMKFVVKSGNFKSVDELKRDHPRAFEKWTDAEQEDLVQLFKNGESIKVIAGQLQRSYGSIKARLERLGLIVPGEAPGGSPAPGKPAQP